MHHKSRRAGLFASALLAAVSFSSRATPQTVEPEKHAFEQQWRSLLGLSSDPATIERIQRTADSEPSAVGILMEPPELRLFNQRQAETDRLIVNIESLPQDAWTTVLGFRQSTLNLHHPTVQVVVKEGADRAAINRFLESLPSGWLFEITSSPINRLERDAIGKSSLSNWTESIALYGRHWPKIRCMPLE